MDSRITSKEHPECQVIIRQSNYFWGVECDCETYEKVFQTKFEAIEAAEEHLKMMDGIRTETQ